MLFRQDPQKENTPLHLAILERNNARALELLHTISKKELNKQSLGNTPLMLALKTANFEVARAILQHEDVDVVPTHFRSTVCDLRGVSPLHLACAWRETDIIQLILDKYNQYIDKYLGGGYQFGTDLPLDDVGEQYELRVRLQLHLFKGHNPYFKHLISERTLGKIYLNSYNIEDIHREIELHDYHKSIVDSDTLILGCAPELTDALLFHSKDICLNLGLVSEDKFKNSPSSQHRFASDLMTGLQSIIEYRNSKPVVEEISVALRGNPTPAAKPKI